MPAADQPCRRSRFRKTPTGKRLSLGARDLQILGWLYRYRYLSSRQLITAVKPHSEKRFIERLGDLFHETGLINRPSAQWQRFDARYRPVTYELTAAGEQLLGQQDALPPRATTLSRRTGTGQFEHAVMIVDALFTVELTTRATPGQRFVPVDEILGRAPEATRLARNPLAVPVTLQPCPELPNLKRPWHTHIIPDGLYGIEYLVDGEKRYRFWALECERTTPARRSNHRLSSVARKQVAYDALITSNAYRDHWGIPNLKLHLVQAKRAWSNSPMAAHRNTTTPSPTLNPPPSG